MEFSITFFNYNASQEKVGFHIEITSTLGGSSHIVRILLYELIVKKSPSYTKSHMITYNKRSKSNISG